MTFLLSKLYSFTKWRTSELS